VVQGVLNSSLNHLTAWLAIRSEDQVIVGFNQALVNKKAGKLLGRSQPQLENTSVLAVMPFLKPAGLFKKFAEVVRTGKPYPTPLRDDQRFAQRV
jgi:two-component system, chemotaxis family, CheB/CheR fusion protein